jgi:hypothetical protein
MRLVCQPTKPQYEKIAADGETALKATIHKFAGTWRRAMPDGQPEPRTLIAEGLLGSVRATLSPEQAARYQKELDQRRAARKRLAVLNLVCKVDQLLVLTAEQREKLGEILKENWNETWGQSQWLTIGNQYFPPMPDDKILPLFTETQKNVWRDSSRRNIRFGFHLGFLQGIEMEEEVWDDDQPQQKPGRADGKAAIKGTETSEPELKK